MNKENEKRQQELQKKEGAEIAYQNKDITAKILAEEFKGKSFAVYGVDIPRIVSVEPTNLPLIEANELRMDNLFYLEDGSYLLVDYESSYDYSNMFKYLSYVARVSKRLYNEKKKVPKIRMLVIYTADVKRGSTKHVMDIGSNKLEITEAFLSEMNHEEIRQRISCKVDAGTALDSKEIMELIVYPLTFEKTEDKQKAIGDVIDLSGELRNDADRIFILKCLMVFTDKIIRKEDTEKIKEALMLTKVEKLMYEEIEEKVIRDVTERITEQVTEQVTEQTTERIARNMLRSGIDADIVSDNTGLSKSTVIELYNSIISENQ